MPAVFLVDKNGNESIVNFNVQGEYMVVNKTGAQFTLRDGDYATCIFNESYKGGTGKQHPAAKVETLTEKKPKKSTSQLKAKSDPVDLSAKGEEDKNWSFLSYLSSHTQSPNAKTFNQ